jgi:hypothetical protein
MIDEARPDIDHWTEKEQARISTPAGVAIVTTETQTADPLRG